MAPFREYLWPILAVAGSFTAAALAYRAATRSRRSNTSTEEPPESTSAHASGQGESDDESEYYDEEVDVTDAQREQSMLIAVRQGSLLLGMFGLVIMTMVFLVAMTITWGNEDEASITDLPMFAPMMWIAVGVFSAASLQALSQGTVEMATSVPVLEDKSVFPNDEADFDLIRRKSTNKGGDDTASSGDEGSSSDDLSSNASVAAYEEELEMGDEEEKAAAPNLDLDDVILKADELFDEEKHLECYEFLQAVLPRHQSSVDIYWRVARSCSFRVEEVKDKGEKERLSFEGLEYAQKAYACDPESALANKWMAILQGGAAKFMDLKSKIRGAYKVRDFAMKALELDPTDHVVPHILGQWCLAVADVTWIEKRTAAALFGTPPSSTYEEALTYFLQTESLKPKSWKHNTYMIALTYFKMKNMLEATKWGHQAKEIPIKTLEDEVFDRKASELLAKLN